MSWAIWITGLPGSGKSAIAAAAARELREVGDPVVVLSLDELRRVLTPAPVYSGAEREIVYRTLVYAATMLTVARVPVIVDATGHRRAWRDLARTSIPVFAEVQLECSLAVCRAREATRPTTAAPTQIYARAGRPGATVPGVDVAYELALAPELILDTETATVPEAAGKIVALAKRLAQRAPRPRGAGRRGWALWITGPPGSGKTTVAAAAVEMLSAHGVLVARLGWSELCAFALTGAYPTPLEEEVLHRGLAVTAKLLTDAGVSVVIDATAPRRAWRDLARRLVSPFAEVQLECSLAVCEERHRAVRWRIAPVPAGSHCEAAPELVPDYQPALTPELTLDTEVQAAVSATQEVVRLALRLERAAGGSRPTVLTPRPG